jgi:hypothetical protein
MRGAMKLDSVSCERVDESNEWSIKPDRKKHPNFG